MNLQSPDPESGGLPISRLLNFCGDVKLKELYRRVKAVRLHHNSALRSALAALTTRSGARRARIWRGFHDICIVKA